MYEAFKSLSIWKVFLEKNRNDFPLEHMMERALPLMDLYYKEFPNYTLHNKQHQLNILNIICLLLGEQVQHLTDLECALLILVASYHDIGMVFNDRQLKEIDKEPKFKGFLNGNFHAKWIYTNNGHQINAELAEWYCRWSHAERVWLFLDEFDQATWNGVTLKKCLGDICQSHNQSVSSLADGKFDINFQGEADLRFCAILLRLGDILDFDNTRTPLSVFEFLALDDPKNRSEEVSRDEWNKHLSSRGFDFKKNPDRTLLFRAGPEHPQIENNIKTFLNVVDQELKDCGEMLKSCCDRWRALQLPLIIDRKGIVPKNYKSGGYHLSLDQNKIIKLLTGENLYEHEFVFIRELLQNAIDTSRMRQFHEKSNGNVLFKILPIEVTCWLDEVGYHWVRVDDNGMGLNEYVLTNHFLKKGDSSYSSDYFLIQHSKYKEKTGEEFKPISRFGIGLLSCFLIGDNLEINTHSVPVPETQAAEEKIRLSITGLDGDYFLQNEKENHRPTTMPCKYGNEKIFRGEFGTSIAVRVQRKKDHIDFVKHLTHYLHEYISCSPIDIHVNGGQIGKKFNELLETPLTDDEYYSFNEVQKNQVEALLEHSIPDELGIKTFHVDLTKDSADPNLKGQAAFIYLHFPDEMEIRKAGQFTFFFLTDNHLNDKKYIRFQKRYIKEGNISEERIADVDVTDIYIQSLGGVKKTGLFEVTDHWRPRQTLHNTLRLIHNGINVPNRKEQAGYRDPQMISFSELFLSPDMRHQDHPYAFLYYGYIYFQDSLIPDLAISRNFIKKISFNIYSSLYIATRSLNEHISSPAFYYSYFDAPHLTFFFEAIRNDRMVKEKHWDKEKLFDTHKGTLSVEEIRNELVKAPVKCAIPKSGIFLHYLMRGLLQIHFEIEFIHADDKGNGSYINIKAIRNSAIGLPEYMDSYQPLLILPFAGAELLSDELFINEKHPYIQWLISENAFLAEKFQGYIHSMLRFIQEGKVDEIQQILEHFKKALPENKRPNLPPLNEKDFIQKKRIGPGF